MNHLHKKIFCLIALMSAASTFSAITTVSKIIPRPQSLNNARQIVGWDNPTWGIHRNHDNERYTSFNAIFEYTRTFRDQRIARCLFGDDLICDACGDSAIKISGSAVEDRNNATDWLADYFGLPRDYQSTVSFKPEISNFLIDFSYYAGLDEWVEGMYFRIHGPFVHTKWNLNARETRNNDTANSIGYFTGYFSDDTIAVDDLNTSFLAYANGATPTIRRERAMLPDNENEIITWQQLCCSKIGNECDCDSLTRNGFGELRFMLGRNLVSDPAGDSHLGVSLYAAAPTGTSIGGDCEQGRYLFEPIIGNGKHWELGGHLTTHRIFWRNEEEDKSFGVYMEVTASHLFAANQTRCFDLCSVGGNSRYMLAYRLQDNRNSVPRLDASVDAPGLEFANEYAPVANLTRRRVASTINVMGDAAISFAYQSGDFQWDLGYNFWGRSCERLTIKDCCTQDIGNWALKGDQPVYGYVQESGKIPVRLAATDSNADIHTGSNLCNGADMTGSAPLDNGIYNQYVDNAALAIVQVKSGEAPININLRDSQGGMEGVQVHTSNPPVLISDCDFDLNGTRGHSHKIFTHFNWAKTDREDSNYVPYMGVGAEVEFGKVESSCCKPCPAACDTSCDTGSCSPSTPSCKKTNCSVKDCCPNCAISQWGIWFKIGASRY